MAGTRPTAASVKPATGKTVLVTDDNRDLRELTARLIDRRGHRVLQAASGAEAIEVCEREPVDLLLLDIMMPEMDGFATLAQLRERGHTQLPVVILTAQNTDENVLAGYRAGVDYYLTKPFRTDALLNIVDYLIGDLSADERAHLEALL